MLVATPSSLVLYLPMSDINKSPSGKNLRKAYPSIRAMGIPNESIRASHTGNAKEE
jgi:hypothetical protein